jgi:peptide/nickel transport system ATP-binding protein
VTEPMLSVTELAVTYHTGSGPIPAVRGVSFDLEQGGSLGLAGESGCGKSTLASAILRLLPTGTEVTGTVRLAGLDIFSLNPGKLRAARWTAGAIVFQGALHALNPVQTVGRQIAEPMRIHQTVTSDQEADRRVAMLLSRVGLAESMAEQFPHRLSGGQRQRVLIAMALACNPLLLVADEPTTALDLMVQAQVLALLDELKREEGLTLLFITHDLSVLTQTCDRLAVMYAGRIVEEGPADKVFVSGAHPYSKALAAAFPVIGDRRSRMSPAGLGGDPPNPDQLPSGCTFHPRCPVAEPRCQVEDPQLREAGPDQRAACVLV